MAESYCFLTGGRCCYYPVVPQLNSFFISEPYDKLRQERENAILQVIKGHTYSIADHKIRNIAISCKICQQIQSSMFGIVDITGSNKNVLIELGMLYGFNKPVIILVERKEKTKIDIPSNIIGIEQVRYSDYAELSSKLAKAVSILFKLAKEQEEYLLNLEPIIDSQIQRLEIVAKAKKLVGQFKGKIIDFKLVNNVGYIVIDKGRIHGIENGMFFEVFQASNKIGRSYLEEFVGIIIVTHSQDKISQCQPWTHDSNHPFWIGTFNAKPPRHVLRVHIPEDVDKMSEEEIEETISTYKLMRSYIPQG